jgi:hypothetical protein
MKKEVIGLPLSQSVVTERTAGTQKGKVKSFKYSSSENRAKLSLSYVESREPMEQ